MVAIKKFSCQKNRNVKGRTLHDIQYYTSPKKMWIGGHFTTYYMKGQCAERTFSILYASTVSLRIHVEFLNGERGKENDRWCRSLYYWLNLSYYSIDNFSSNYSLLICWSPIGDFCQNFGHQKFFPLAMATKMVAAWSTE